MAVDKKKVIKATITGMLVTAPMQSAAFAENPFFSDLISNGHEKDILALAKKNIITGYTDGTFKQTKQISRAEAATILARALQLTGENAPALKFSDVDPSSYYYKSLAALVEKGIINGYEDNTYKPDEHLTREQMAKILGVAYNLSSNSKSVFNDVASDNYAYQYINGLYEASITQGFTKTSFNPSGFVTREQMASFINRALQYKEEKQVKGKITEVSLDTIQIENETYSLSKNLATKVTEKFLKSLKNAEVKIVVQDNKIVAFKDVTISEKIEQFDGGSISIENLTFTKGVEQLQNVQAENIIVTTDAPKIQLSNIESKNLKITKNKAVTASLNPIAVTIGLQVDFEKSNQIQNVLINADTVVYEASGNSKINHVEIHTANPIVINSDVALLSVGHTASISGTGQIKQLEILNKDAVISIADNISIGEFIYNNQYYKYDQLSSLGIQIKVESSTSAGGSSSGSSGGSSQPSTPGGNNTGGSGSDESNTGGGSTTGDGSNSSDNNSGGTTTPEETIVELDSPSSIVNKEDEKVTLNINNETMEVTNTALVDLLASEQVNNISNLNVIVENNKVIGVKALTYNAPANTTTFNANNIQAETVTVTGNVTNVAGVEKVETLNVTTTAQTMSFNADEHLTANVYIQALNVTDIHDLNTTGTVTVTTANQEITLNITASKVILEESQLARLSFQRVASLSMMPFIAQNTNTTKITITNNSDELVINRDQVLLNIQGDSYSKITVSGDNTMIDGNVAHLIATENVGYLTIYQTINKLDIVGAVTPLVITGGGTIENLKVSNSAPSIIDISGVTVDGTPDDPNGSIISSTPTTPIPPTTPPLAISVGSATSDFAYYDFKVTVGANQKVKFVQLKQGETISLDTIPTGANVETYNGSKFLLEFNTEKIAAFLVDTSSGSETLVSSALIATPERYHSQPVGYENKAFNFISPFNQDTPLASFAKYAYVFVGGKATKEFKTLPGSAIYDASSKYVNWTLETGVDLPKDIIVVMDDLIASMSPTEQTRVVAFQTMAKHAVEQKNPMMMKRLLADLSLKEGIVIDRNLMQIYAERIHANPTTFDTVAKLTTLVEKIADEITYDKDVIPSLDTLLLEDQNVTFTSANSNVVTATPSNGQILLVPGGTDGITVITAKDGAGNITKVVVEVVDGKVAQFVPQMIEQTNNISIIYGDQSKYRTKTDATGKTFIIPEVDSTLIIRDSSSEMKLQKLSLNSGNNPADLTIVKTQINAAKATLAELGLTATQPIENTNVGMIVEGNNVWFYPITTTETNLKLTDATNSTSVNVKPNATTVVIEIAKSDAASIANELGLTNVEKVSNSPNTNKIHSTATATELTFFANDGATAAFTAEDGSGRKTLLNVQSTNTNGKVTLTNPTIIVHEISEASPVHSFSENFVRIVGNKIYPTGSGTAKVTLTDGTIYTIETSLVNNVYTSTVKKETAFKIDAEALDLIDIVSSTENVLNNTAAIANKQTIANKELVFTMTDGGTAEVIVTDSLGAKTLFYVTATNTNGTVTYGQADIIDATVTKENLGFTAITGTIDKIKSYARTAFTNNEVTVYGYTAGKQSAEVYNGLEKALVNIEAKKDPAINKLQVTATPVTTTLAETIHADANGDSIIRIKNGTLYAMNTGTVEIQVVSTTPGIARFAQLTVSQDPATGHYSISAPVYIEKHVLTIDNLGLTSIVEATSNNPDVVKVVKDGEQIIISKTGTLTSPARITVTGTNAETTYVHVTTDFKAIVEKSNSLDLATAELENITQEAWLNGTSVRAVTNNTSVTFYSLLTGKASYKVTDSKGKTAIINITDAPTNNANTKQAEIVKKALPTGLTGTLIAGDAVRVGSDGNTLYATKDGTVRILLSDGKIHEYTVTQTSNHYTISEPTVIDNSFTINLKDVLGFTNPNTVKVEDETKATAAINGDLLTIYKVADGKTPITLTDSTGKTLVFNVDTTQANMFNVAAPVKLATQLTANPTLLHAVEDAGIIKVQENNNQFEVLAQSFGDVEVLYNNKVHRISVVNNNGVAEVSINEISSAILTKGALGLSNALVVPESYDKDNYFITKIGENLVAYAKTANSTQEVTITDGTTNKTVVRITADGNSYVTHKVAKEENVLTVPGDYGLSSITSFTVKSDKAYARYSSNTLYSLQQGETYATLSDNTNKALAAISITRDANDYLKAEIKPIKKSADELVSGATTIEAMPNKGTDTNVVAIRGNTLYATGLGTTLVRVGNFVVEITVDMNPNTDKYEMTAIKMESAAITSTQLGLNAITSFDLSANAAQVVQTVKNDNTLIFYGKAAGSAQVTVTETDGANTWKGLINITVASDGQISATPVKYNAAITAPVAKATAETKQNEQARAIWNDSNIEVYLVSEGKSAIKFDNGTFNVEVKKDSTTGAYSFVGTPAFASTKINATGLNVISGSTFAHTEEVSGETVLVAKDAGKVILVSADTIYQVTISKDANGHVSISAPTALPFKSLEITSGYTIAGNSVATLEADIDNDRDNELIVYPTGTNGTSDIHFTSDQGDQTTYQVKVTNNIFESASPKQAAKALPTGITNAKVVGSNISIHSNQLHLHNIGNAYIEGDEGFVNVVVERDANGYFTTVETKVSESLSEAIVYPVPPLTNFEWNNSTLEITPIQLTSGTDVVYTASKRVELSTKVENGLVAFSKIEQDMAIIPYRDYNLATLTPVSNSNPTVAKAEVRADGALVVYALEAGQTAITYKDGDKSITIYANVDANKNLTTTIAGESAAIKLADIGITGEVALKSFKVDDNGAVVLTDFESTKVTPNISNEIIRFTANETGKTSFAITQAGAVKAFVNVEVYKDANDQLAARTTIVETNVNIAATQISGANLFRTHDGKHYATGVGAAVYKTAASEATIVRIGQVQIDETTNTFSHSTSKRHLIEFNSTNDFGFNTISSAIIADTVVADGALKDNVAYIYAKNNGVTDVLVADNTNATANKAIVQVTNTNGTLTTKTAKEELPTNLSGLTDGWIDTKGLLQVRSNNIYALATGDTTIKNTAGVIANVTIQRDTTLPFKTTVNVPKVQPSAGNNVTILTGAAFVHAVGDTVYAKAAGEAKVQVNGTIQAIKVTQAANGHFAIESVPVKEQVELNANELGMSSITSATITSDIISTDLQDVDNAVTGKELVLLAEQAGTAVLTVTGTSDSETVQTKVQVTVNATNNVLSFDQPIIASTSINGVSLEKSDSYTNNAIVRAHNGQLFALQVGETFVQDANRTLYKVKAEQTDALRVAASELSYTFANATSISSTSANVTISGKKVLIKALDFTADLMVDSVSYRLTVDINGQISVQSLAQNTVDLAEVFDGSKAITANAGDISDFLKVTHTLNDTKITLEPLQTAAAEKVIRLTSDGKTVQLLVKVVADGAGYKATAELVSKQFAAADIGFHMEDENFNISNGIAKVEGGVLKVYPGEIGTHDFVVKHTLNGATLRKTIMRLDVTNINQYTVGKLAHTITDNAFVDSTKVIAQHGTALATGGTNIAITNFDGDPTLFIVSTSDGYRQFTVSTTPNGNTYDVTQTDVVSPYKVAADVTNVNGAFFTSKDGSNTIIYSNTAGTGSAIIKDVIHNLVADATANNVVTATNVTVPELSGDYTFVSGTDNVEKLTDGTWAAKAEGTAYYKNATSYKKVVVKLKDDNSNHYEVIVSDVAHQTLDASYSNITLLKHPANVFVDGNTIYGEVDNTNTANIVVAAFNGEHRELLIGRTLNTDITTNLKTFKIDILDELDWTNVASVNINQGENMARIVNAAGSSTLYVQNFGTFSATFTAASGVTKTLTFEIDTDYNIGPISTGNNTIAYELNPDIGGINNAKSFEITFDLNISSNTKLESGHNSSQFIILNSVTINPSQTTSYNQPIKITTPEISPAAADGTVTPVTTSINGTLGTDWTVTVTDQLGNVNFIQSN